MGNINPIYNKALQFLSRREHSQAELTQKLLRAFPDAQAEIEQCCSELIKRNYLSNERFLTSRIQHRLNQAYGPERIIAELVHLHHLSRDSAASALAAAQEDTGNAPLKALIAKKALNLDLTDFKVRQKLVAHCLRRGFHLSEVKAALHDVGAQPDNVFPD